MGKCKYPSCANRSASYNFKGEKTPRYCKYHKHPGMVNVRDKKCEHKGCVRFAKYNFEGEKRPRYCTNHKHPEMVNVVHKICEHEGCNTIAGYNFEGEKRPRYCKYHMDPGMINVISKRCKQDNCDILVSNQKYKGYCLRCFIYLFPGQPVCRNYKTKEIYIKDKLQEKFPELTWRNDKPVSGGCSRRRPDMLVDFGYLVLIIEIGENQHKAYDPKCEQKRLNELFLDLGGRPIVFIRFNPDDYIDSQGDKVKSCWTTNKLGICVVKKSKQQEMDQRMSALYGLVQKYTDEKTADKFEGISVKSLFFDETLNDATEHDTFSTEQNQHDLQSISTCGQISPLQDQADSAEHEPRSHSSPESTQKYIDPVCKQSWNEIFSPTGSDKKRKSEQTAPSRSKKRKALMEAANNTKKITEYFRLQNK